MFRARYAKVQRDSLNLFDNVGYADLTKRHWHIRTTLKYANLHEGFVICDSHDITALFFLFPDGTVRLVERVEIHFDAPGMVFGLNQLPWQVRVKCEGLYESFPVGQAKDDIMDIYLERLAFELGKASLLIQ